VEVHVGLEVDANGQAMAWIGELPGCHVRGHTEAVALEKVPLAVYEYCVWLRAHGEEIADPGTVEIVAVERVEVPTDLGQALSHAIFQFDRLPLAPDLSRLALRATQYARLDLLEMLPALHPDMRGRLEGVSRTLGQTLDHLVLTDLWQAIRTLDPEDVETRIYLLDMVRGGILPLLEEAASHTGRERAYTALTLETGEEERWTGYKVLRRAVGHERLHFRHLQRLDGRLRAAEPSP
jgi:predicted RNase H-like HicB family nuclease